MRKLRRLSIKEDGYENCFPFLVKARFISSKKSAIWMLERIVRFFPPEWGCLNPVIKRPFDRPSYYSSGSYLSLELNKKRKYWYLEAFFIGGGDSNLSFQESGIKSLVTDSLIYN